MNKRVVYIGKLSFASTAFVILILLLWKVLFSSSCVVLIIPIAFIFLITKSFVDIQMHRRKSYRDYYFIKNSFISNVLSSSLILFVFYFLYSLMLTITILYSVIDFQGLFWLYLLIHISLCTALYEFLNRSLRYTIKPKFVNVFAREVAIKISAVFLLMSYFYIFIYGFEPEYLDGDLKQTIQNASALYRSNCEIIDLVLRSKAEIDSMFWWFADRVAGSTEDDAMRKLIWFVFFLINGFAIIGLNRFVGQVIFWCDLKFAKWEGEGGRDNDR